AVQDEIAGLIAQNLKVTLGAGSTASTAAIDPRALQFYLQSRQAWNLRTPAGLGQAEELLGQAIALAPRFARAHAALADVWLIAGQGKFINPFDQRHSPELRRIAAKVEEAIGI